MEYISRVEIDIYIYMCVLMCLHGWAGGCLGKQGLDCFGKKWDQVAIL